MVSMMVGDNRRAIFRDSDEVVLNWEATGWRTRPGSVAADVEKEGSSMEARKFLSCFQPTRSPSQRGRLIRADPRALLKKWVS
jgi:hypothetical protein